MQPILALDGGEPVRREPLPSWPQWSEREQALLEQTLSSGQWWAPGGSQVHALEAEFAAYQDAQYGVAVTNGSAALEVCLHAASIDWGDEVITSSYSFVATPNACLLVGAIPRFVDVLPDTWNLDPAQIEAAITPRTKAIIPVHIGGEPADMDAVMEIARRHKLLVIEDACQAHGALWRERKVGAIGDMGCFSFQASKNLNGGEGGMIVTNDEAWAERCWSASNVGRPRQGEWYRDISLSSNHRMAEWPAAILRGQLERLEQQTQTRADNAAYLARALHEIKGLDATRLAPGVTRSAYHLLKLWYNPSFFGDHDAALFSKAVMAEGVPITCGYPEPLGSNAMVNNRVTFIRNQLHLHHDPAPAWPVCQQVCRHGLWLRQSALLGSRYDMDDIVRAIAKVQRAWQR